MKARKNSGGCPICGKSPEAEFRPFCSRRCKDVDLSRWFGESYRIPAVDEDAAEDMELDDGGGEQ